VRSAIYFPDIQINTEATMQAALLMWDQVKVIVPFQDFPIFYEDKDMAAGWELIGSTMTPDDAQQECAHQNIWALLQGGTSVDVLYRDNTPADEIYEMYPQKLLYKTWQMLEAAQMTSAPLANGDYPFREQAGFAIMAKLADACAGNTFARWTDRFLAYGLVADRDPEAAAQTTVIPLTLSVLDAGLISTEKLIDFRRREEKEQNGGDYTAMRHRYSDLISAHIEATKNVRSVNELVELRRQFESDVRRDFKELCDALKTNWVDAVTAPVVVTSVVAAGSWLAGHGLEALTIGTFAGAGAGSVIQRVVDLFRARNGFSTKQRDILAEHPMAYLYQLSRAQ
jgi:hypothetical protein